MSAQSGNTPWKGSAAGGLSPDDAVERAEEVVNRATVRWWARRLLRRAGVAFAIAVPLLAAAVAGLGSGLLEAPVGLWIGPLALVAAAAGMLVLLVAAVLALVAVAGTLGPAWRVLTECATESWLRGVDAQVRARRRASLLD